MKIVNADDSTQIRERIKNQIKCFDQVTIVGEADNGRTALKMVLEFSPDLVILDLHMPEMGGMEVLKKIKEANMKTKVCILTGYSYPQYRARCLTLGADFFLSKSDDFEKLNLVIANMLKETLSSPIC
jgi:DNA-binding NarL/FixJ family response regulator